MSALAALALVVTTACSTGTPAPPTAPILDGSGATAVTDRGPVRGLLDGPVLRFAGIPYAAAPTGPLRFAPPTEPGTWTAVRDATRPGPVCPQPTAQLLPGQSVDEDCLTVNVTAPAEPAASPRPVLVWIHGGGFTFGSGSEYDGAPLASRGDLVVITLNYRLGMLGGFGVPTPPGGVDQHNLALQDQTAALRWVRANAAAFGGDPAAVTLAGESAGALSTCSLLASPPAADLFARAIIASGSCRTHHPAGALSPQLPAVSTWNTHAAADAFGQQIATSVGCADPATVLDCLRARPVDDLVALGPAFTTFAHGTPSLPHDPGTAPRADWASAVPVLSGNTSDEHLGNILTAYPDATAATYRSLLATSFGADADRVARRYPLTDFPDPTRALARIYTDTDWFCPTVSINRDYARTAPTWTYLFADPDAPALAGESVPRPAATHGSDVTYTLPTLGPTRQELTVAQQRLADQMIDYWATFARTGDPNGPGLPAWPPTTPTSAPARQLTPQPGPSVLDTAARCA